MQTVSWVIYQANHKKASGLNSVCEQSEWETMVAIRPEYYTLIRAGFTSENAAEIAARPPEVPKIRPKTRN